MMIRKFSEISEDALYLKRARRVDETLSSRRKFFRVHRLFEVVGLVVWGQIQTDSRTHNRRRTLTGLTSKQPIILCSPFMSHAHPTASSSFNQVSNFQLIINNALDEYKKRTKKDLLAHPLVTELQSCNTPNAILSVLQRQAQGLDRSRRSDDRWTRWLDSTVNVLFTLSATLGEGVSLVCVTTSDYLRSVLTYVGRYFRRPK